MYDKTHVHNKQILISGENKIRYVKYKLYDTIQNYRIQIPGRKYMPEFMWQHIANKQGYNVKHTTKFVWQYTELLFSEVLDYRFLIYFV